jgi:hypothetical protein
VPQRLRRWQWVDFYSDRGYQKLLAACAHRAHQLGLELQSKAKRGTAKSGHKTVQMPSLKVVSERKRSHNIRLGDPVVVSRGPLEGVEGTVHLFKPPLVSSC